MYLIFGHEQTCVIIVVKPVDTAISQRFFTERQRIAAFKIFLFDFSNKKCIFARQNFF